jgi:hypothetical protein
MMSIDVDTAAVQQLSTMLGATEKQMVSARTRALRKMRKKIETRIKREVARAERIPQKSLGSRVFSGRLTDADDELKVWIGTWNVSPFSVGSPRQTTRGVRAGRRSYPGAFLAQVYSPETQVWIRLHSKYYAPELYPTNYRPGDRGVGSNRGRFPVVRAAIPIDGAVERILASSEAFFAAEFEKLYGQELNYELNVRGRA